MLVYSVTQQSLVSELSVSILNNPSRTCNRAMHIRLTFIPAWGGVGKVRSRGLGLLRTLKIHSSFLGNVSFSGSDLDPTPLWYYSLELCMMGVIYI